MNEVPNLLNAADNQLTLGSDSKNAYSLNKLKKCQLICKMFEKLRRAYLGET